MVNDRFTFLVKTMGCKANIYDSLLIERDLCDIGGVRADNFPDIFVLNSCTVTNEADKQCLKEIENFKKKSPKSVTIITGSYAEVEKEKLNADVVIPNSSKQKLRNIISEKLGLTDVSVKNAIYEEERIQ